MFVGNRDWIIDNIDTSCRLVGIAEYIISHRSALKGVYACEGNVIFASLLFQAISIVPGAQ